MTIDELRLLLARLLDNKNKLREAIYQNAKNHIGWDLSVQSSNELGCAESVSKIVQISVPNFPTFLSTTEMYAWLMGHWTQVSNPARGDIIISPTGYGKGHGHTGIMGDGVIYSNNAYTGKFDRHLTIGKWKQLLPSFPIYYFRVK